MPKEKRIPMRIFTISLLFILALTNSPSYLFGQDIRVEVVQGTKYIVHSVSTGETLYSIAKKYDISESDIKKGNAFALRNGLKAGTSLYIPYKDEYKSFVNSTSSTKRGTIQASTGIQNSTLRTKTIQGDKYLVHSISPGETLYSLSRQYNISESDLKKYNTSTLDQGLKAGAELLIPYKEEYENLSASNQGYQGVARQAKQTAAPVNNKEQTNQGVIRFPQKTDLVIHTVARKETLSSISRHYNITVNDIIKYNPDINPNKKLKKRTKLTIPQYTTQQEDETYFYYTIKKQETPFYYSRIYDISIDDIFKANPHLSKSHFPIGEIIRIPKKQGTQTLNSSAILEPHTVKSKETLYGLSKMYNCTERQLLAINKHLEKGVTTGTIIYIPTDYSGLNTVTLTTDNPNILIYTSSGNEDVIGIADKTGYDLNSIIKFNRQLLERRSNKGEIIYIPKKGLYTETCFYRILSKESILLDCKSAKPNTSKTINIIAILPLSGNTDKYRAGERFFRFYDGFLIALDRLEKEGAKIHTTFIDDENSVENVENALKLAGSKDLDLIVGPMYAETQNPASTFSRANNIPMVSPFVYNKEQTSKNKMFYNTTPDKTAYTSLLAKYIANSANDVNIVSINGTDYEETEEYLVYKKLKSLLPATADITETTNSYMAEFLKPDRPNIILISSTNEAKVNLCVTYLSRMSKRYDIRIVSTYDYDRYRSLQQEYLHNTKFTYINPYFLDKTLRLTKEVSDLSRELFAYEPNNYNMQGFDVGYYFIGAIYQYGKKFADCIENYTPDLTQGNYKFEKDDKGYTNSRLQIIEYSSDFNKRVIATVDEKGVIMK